jgi:uncharacterized membrane protein YdbT with pleckstrin-like domain
MGSYVNNNLISGEQVIYEAKNHWITYISLRSFSSLFVLPLIDSLTSEYAITNKRVIIKVGLISRRTVEMNLSKIESVNVDQSIVGRLLGYGEISLNGTGGTKESCRDISDPTTFRRVFQESIDQNLP